MIDMLTNYYFRFELKENLRDKFFIVVVIDIPN
jgi:hypothetical protein